MGLKKINAELDIRNLSQELRTLKFISHVLLTKYQRDLIPHFRENLLNYHEKEIALLIKRQQTISMSKVLKRTESAAEKELEDKKLVEALWRTISACKDSKMDLRLLKSLDGTVDLP